MRLVRGLGEPALFAITASTVGSTVYFALGVVAGDALGLTPLAFLAAAIFFVLTMLTYAEASSLHAERGGASTFARYAFNELWSFIAGWAIMLDYLIVMAIAAFSISHYLTPFWGETGAAIPELAIAAGAIGFVAVSNVRGLTAERLRIVLRVGLVNILVLGVAMVVVAATVWDPAAITDSIEFGAQPEWEEFVFAAVVATVMLTGIEAASGLAGEIRVGRRRLRRAISVGAAIVFVALLGVSIVALMAVPVEDGATALGSTYVEAPVLGVVDSLDPGTMRDTLRVAVGFTAAFVLVMAVQGNMLGLSRLGYSLATNRQIPSAVGKLGSRRGTPYVTILIAAGLAFVLAIPRDIEFLAGIFAFGAMIAFTLAHISVIVLRFREPEGTRAFRIPLSIRVGKGSVPLPALLGAVVGLGAFASVVAFHEGARIVGGAWMLGGLLLYVIYRKAQGRSLAKRYTVPAAALQKDLPGAEYGNILVPIFGSPLDDDIVGTAGRLAAEEASDGEGEVTIEAIYVLEIPMSLPLTARVADEVTDAAKKARDRAKAVGEEYEGVLVATATVAHGPSARGSWRRLAVAGSTRSSSRPSARRGRVAARSWAAAADRRTSSSAISRST